MQLKRIGQHGPVAAVLGLGCNNFGMKLAQPQAVEVIHAAMDHGVTFFDTAASYLGSEEMLGAGLKGRRAQALIATKFGSPRDPVVEGGHAKGSDAYIRASIDGSLRRLGVDHIDLYQIHAADPLTPIHQTLESLDALRHAGKIRYIGCSGFTPAQLIAADQAAKELDIQGFISSQHEWSLLSRGVEASHLPTLQACGMAVIPFFPLASGLLAVLPDVEGRAPAGSRLSAGPFAGQLTAERVTRARQLAELAAQMGRSLPELALGLLAAHPCAGPVIAGATSPAQVAANVKAVAWIAEAQPLITDILGPPA